MAYVSYVSHATAPLLPFRRVDAGRRFDAGRRVLLPDVCLVGVNAPVLLD